VSATRQRLIIYGAQGKIRGIIENRVLRQSLYIVCYGGNGIDSG
jgi:hypothetical protein